MPWWVPRGLSGLASGRPEWLRDRQIAMQREFQYRVYLMGYGRKRERERGKERSGKKRGKERKRRRKGGREV